MRIDARESLVWKNLNVTTQSTACYVTFEEEKKNKAGYVFALQNGYLLYLQVSCWVTLSEPRKLLNPELSNET